MYLIGIDDTDNLQSRGTGYRARMLGEAIGAARLGQVRTMTRHQLLVHPDIRYTSHNSSACLLVDSPAPRRDLFAHCAAFLRQESAPGSDAGLCLLEPTAAGQEVRQFGERAKREVLRVEEAHALARRSGAMLEGLTGDGGGVIGALAAVGLRAGGNDGRFLWLPGLREISGTLPVSALGSLGIDVVRTVDGEVAGANDLIDLGDWVRPVLQDGQIVLFAERTPGGWQVAPRAVIKALSE